jgi:alanyl-tRNA synthetase
MTERLYLDNAYLFEFESTVKDIRKIDSGFEVILQSTAFYPDSGGQLHDLGLLDNKKVTGVIETDSDDIVHIVEGWTADVGLAVRGNIDRERRLDNMRKHTGQHILSQSFMRVASAKTCSSHLGEIESTIELTSSAIDDEILLKAERLANKIILENHPIRINYYSREQLRGLPIRKIPEREGQYRIVQIGDFDYTACGGTHCRHSGEVGLVKIIGQEKIRGHTRLIFLTGLQATEDYYYKDKITDQLSGKLTCHFLDLPDAVEKLTNQNSELRREISRLNQELIPHEMARLLEGAREIKGVKLISENMLNKDAKDVKGLANKLCKASEVVAVFAVEDRIIISVSEGIKTKASRLAELYMEKFGGKGGGSASFAQIGGLSAQEATDYLKNFVEVVKSEIER